MTKEAENLNILLQHSLDIAGVSSINCDKGWHDGSCCCNCKHHYEDFYHCTTLPNPEGIEGCVCSTHKGWVCLISFEGEQPRAYSNWSEHGMCEMYERRQ